MSRLRAWWLLTVLRRSPESLYDWMRDPTHAYYASWWGADCHACGCSARGCDALMPWPSGYDACCDRCGEDRTAHDLVAFA